MNIFRHIFIAAYKSVHDLKWMASQRQYRGRAFAYFFVLLCVVVGVRGWFFVHDVPSIMSEQWNRIESQIPDFRVEKNDEGLSVTGIDQPYIHTFEEDGDRVLVYVDTVTTSSIRIEDVIGTSTDTYAIVVTSKKIKFFDKDTEQTQTEDVSQLPQMSFTKADVGNEIRTLDDTFPTWIFIFGVVCVTLFWGIGKMAHLLLLSWLVYAVARADKKPWTLWQIFVVSLYASTIPIVLQQGMTLLFGYPIPYIYSIVAVAILFAIIYKGSAGILPEKPGVSPDVSEPPKK